jgi:DNA polymerase I-like protein with 3'-5' exonuclease and polymerase domains
METRKLVSCDTECLGLDVYHGSASPFLVTIGTDNGEIFFEWFVDYTTRQPIIPPDDIVEIQRILDDADEIAMQNGKYDLAVLKTIGIRLDWYKVRDTLVAGHLLGSNLRHDLYTMSEQYLRVKLQHFEDATEEAVNEARQIAKEEYGGKVIKVTRNSVLSQPKWIIAEKGLPNMPSIKGGSKKNEKGVESEKPWKADLALPRSLAKEKNYRLADCTVVNVRREECDVAIHRGGKWGNPFKIGGVYDREGAIARYREWVVLQPQLMKALPELVGKRIGCYCSPEACHGDVLRELVRTKCSHPWWFVTRDYANADSAITLQLWKVMEKEIRSRGYWEIFLNQMKLPRIACEMERRGVTLNRSELERVRHKYQIDLEKADKVCVGIAEDFGATLSLPKGSGTNNSLKDFLFAKREVKTKQPNGIITTELVPCPGLGLSPVRWTDGGGASTDDATLETWENTLPSNSPEKVFIETLREKRKKSKATEYLDSYEKFWIPLGIYNNSGEQLWYNLHPSLNTTGTDTLRWSSSAPNSQQVSKKESECKSCKGDGCNLCDHTGIALWSLRRCFGPGPGREWYSADAENIELRIPAYEAQEKDVMDVFDYPDKPPYFGSHHLLVFDTFWPDIFKKHGREVKTLYESENYQWTKNGTYCVPMSTTALTRSGWKGYDQIAIGDEVAGYKNGSLVWTPVLEKVKFDDAELIEISNGHFSAVTTPNHRWIGSKRVGFMGERFNEDAIFETRGIKSEHTIRLSAPMQDAGTLNITPMEAALIALVYTDGSIERSNISEGYAPSQSGGTKCMFRAMIHQSKPGGIAYINHVLTSVGISFKKRIEKSETCTSGEITRWTLDNEAARELWRRAGLYNPSHSKFDPNFEDFVLKLGSECREEFLAATYAAEGCVDTRRPGYAKNYAQNEGRFADAIRLAIFLCGSFPSTTRKGASSSGNICLNFRACKPYVTGQRIKKRSAGRGDVWCIVTALSSWVMRQGDQIMLTGNSRQYGSQKAKTDQTFHFPGAHDVLASRFPKIDALNKMYLAQANKYGYVETIPDKSVDPTKGYPILCSRTENGGIIPTTPFCYHVSGTACMWMDKALIRCQEQMEVWQREGFDAFMTLTVHDEIVFDMPKRAHPKKNPKESNLGRVRILKQLMETGGLDISVPTPTSWEYHEENWAKGISIKF